MGGGADYDLSTLRNYADGPLETAINNLKKARAKIDDGQPVPDAYPPRARHASDKHGEALQHASTALSDAFDKTIKVLEGLKSSIDNYHQTEQQNTDSQHRVNDRLASL
jgi:hypothetical protein